LNETVYFDLVFLKKISRTQRRQLIHAIQQHNQKSNGVVQMKEKQTSMFPVKEIIHFGAEMMIWEKVTPSST
jgi:hypothetical protein